MSYGCLRGSRCQFAHGTDDLRLRKPGYGEDAKACFSDSGSNNSSNSYDSPLDFDLGEKKKDKEKERQKEAKLESIAIQCDIHQNAHLKNALDQNPNIKGNTGANYVDRRFVKKENLRLVVPKEFTGNLRTSFKDGETKKYDRTTLLLFQHMYVTPPTNLDLDWLNKQFKEMMYMNWVGRKPARVHTRRRSVGGASTGWRLHDESRASVVGGSNVIASEIHKDKDLPDFGLPSENQVTQPQNRRNSFPDIIFSGEVDDDWKAAVMSATKEPTTPGPGNRRGNGKNPFAFTPTERMSKLKMALHKNAGL